MSIKRIWSGAAALVIAAGLAPGAKAEETLRVVTGVSARLVVSQVFLTWADEVNKRGKGIVQFKYLGAGEITPPFQQAQALKRGLFDVLYAPAAFYAGQVKEVDALLASNLTIDQMRKNGAIDYLQKLWRAQLGAHILGWFDTHVAFHLYAGKNGTVNVPKTVADLSTMLRGMKMFSTPTFREFQVAVGATPVSLKIPEVLPSLQKGVIQGYGWPEYGVTALGLQRVTSARIDPTFYRGNILTLINGKKWDSLPQKAKDFLTAEALKYEGASAAFVKKEVQREQDIMKKAGMKVITLKGEIAKRYRTIAHDIAWKRLEKRSPTHAAKLRALMYDPKLN